MAMLGHHEIADGTAKQYEHSNIVLRLTESITEGSRNHADNDTRQHPQAAGIDHLL